MTTATVEIRNKKGLHARAAAKFVKIVGAGKSKVTVARHGDEAVVQGGSILGLMMLGAEKGTMLHLTAEGKDAKKVLQALIALVENKFDEPE